MKYTNKIFAALAILAITPFTYAATLSVNSITAVDANTLKVTLSENQNFPEGEIKWEITVMNDMSIRGAIKSETDDKSVEIRLGDDLLPNTSYSLLNISGANGNIDFITPENVEGFRVANPNVSLEQNIESIEILDSETILVHYVNPVNATGYGYKLLAESKVTSITKEKYDVPELTLTVEPPLTSNKDYILMIIELQDVDGNYLEFDTGIYDFKTEEITPPVLAEPTLEDLAGNTGATLESETNMDMNAAGPETTDISAETQAEGNIQEVAAQATQTPDTGTETWVLVFATLFINTSIFFARRKKALAV